jgi:hypothetical protein
MRAVVFRSGWMKRYAGPIPGDERPIGGGSYNETHRGLEVSNFKPYQGKLYRYVRTRSTATGANPSRIDPNANESCTLNDALVIFMATHPVRGRQRGIGWYKAATVYAKSQYYPHNPNRSVVTTAPANRAVLLPPEDRRWIVPTDKGGMRQTTIRYPYNQRGQLDVPSWFREIVSKIETYMGENHLDRLQCRR